MDKPANIAGETRAARRPGRDGDTGGTVKTVPYGDEGRAGFYNVPNIRQDRAYKTGYTGPGGRQKDGGTT
jgi:hypothetical protein